MWLDRKLIDYLPPVLQQTREMQAVMEGEQPAVAGLWDAWKTVLDALFVRYANEQGLARWERMLGIRPRRDRQHGSAAVAVLARLNETAPVYRADAAPDAGRRLRAGRVHAGDHL